MSVKKRNRKQVRRLIKEAMNPDDINFDEAQRAAHDSKFYVAASDMLGMLMDMAGYEEEVAMHWFKELMDDAMRRAKEDLASADEDFE